jgi:hypothetical protein
MYSIDQGGQAAAPDVTLKGSTVKIVMPSIGATYTGNLSGDGNSITGKWTTSFGGGIPLTLNLTRATAETAWKLPEPPPPPRMMPPDADPAFEVASIKPTNPGERSGGIRMQGRQFTATNLSVSNLILIAYGIHPRQLIGAPDWFEKDRYDILGKPDVEGQPNNKQMRALFQKLLADVEDSSLQNTRKVRYSHVLGDKFTRAIEEHGGISFRIFFACRKAGG